MTSARSVSGCGRRALFRFEEYMKCDSVERQKLSRKGAGPEADSVFAVSLAWGRGYVRCRPNAVRSSSSRVRGRRSPQLAADLLRGTVSQERAFGQVQMELAPQSTVARRAETDPVALGSASNSSRARPGAARNAQPPCRGSAVRVQRDREHDLSKPGLPETPSLS